MQTPIYWESVHSRRYRFPTSCLRYLWRTPMMERTLAFGLLLLCTSVRSSAQIDQVTKALGLGSQRQLTDSKVSAGLKEALRVGAENSVKLTGKTDGYFASQAIKILLPKNLHPLEKGLGLMGYQSKVDAFVLSMNRAAEAAAPSARKIFGDAILA